MTSENETEVAVDVTSCASWINRKDDEANGMETKPIRPDTGLEGVPHFPSVQHVHL